MLEQLFRFLVVGRKFKCTLHLGTRQVRFFLLEVDAREHGAYERGVASLERSLELLDRIVKLATPMTDFAKTTVRGGIGRFGAQNATILVFGGIETPGSEFLASMTNVRGCAVRGDTRSTGIRCL